MQDSTHSTREIAERARALVARLDALGATRAMGVLQQSEEAARLREALGIEPPRHCRSECCRYPAAEVAR